MRTQGYGRLHRPLVLARHGTTPRWCSSDKSKKQVFFDRLQSPAVAAVVDEIQKAEDTQHTRIERYRCVPGLVLAQAAAILSSPDVGYAAGIFAAEPSNALSLPTWTIHTSSVIEWAIAMFLMWRYGEVSGNERWKGMTWGMLPCLGSAMCACTWHFFYNSPDLEFLVALQAFLTIVGNTTCWIAAYRIYQSSVQQQE